MVGTAPGVIVTQGVASAVGDGSGGGVAADDGQRKQDMSYAA